MQQANPTNNVVMQLTQVSRAFPTPNGPLTVLHASDLTIERGEFVSIAGPSGSGKTTLLNLVCGLDQPTTGSVTLFGQRIDRWSTAQGDALRRRIGLVFQSFALLPSCTASENVELALRIAGDVPRQAWDGRVRRCLQAVGLDEWRDHRPFELSGGQQQRVALARALVTRPTLILADEPTGQLDPITARRIWGLLRDLCTQAGIAVLVATHDPLVEAFATRRYQISAGELQESVFSFR